MRIIKPTDRVLSVTHSDMDGIGAQLILSHIFQNITYQFSPFGSVEKLFNDTNFYGYNHIFLTDIYPNYPEMIKKYEDRIVMLDHHGTSLIHHNPKMMRFISTDQCATALVKNFVERYFKIDLSYLNQFVYHVNDYDLWIHGSPKSKELNLLFEMYKDMDRTYAKFRSRFFMGDMNFTQDEINYIDYKHAEYIDVYKNVSGMDFETINACMVMDLENFVNDICEDLLKKENYDLVVFRNKLSGHAGVRHKIPGLNIGAVLKELNIGGGHEYAAGINILEVKLLIKAIKDLEKYLYDRYPQIRRKQGDGDLPF
jgi:oligoribonuclease NrnB/cAMP/cGMP phosphodiesterase (DHH superfamily)